MSLVSSTLLSAFTSPPVLVTGRVALLSTLGCQIVGRVLTAECIRSRLPQGWGERIVQVAQHSLFTYVITFCAICVCSPHLFSLFSCTLLYVLGVIQRLLLPPNPPYKVMGDSPGRWFLGAYPQWAWRLLLKRAFSMEELQQAENQIQSSESGTLSFQALSAFYAYIVSGQDVVDHSVDGFVRMVYGGRYCDVVPPEVTAQNEISAQFHRKEILNFYSQRVATQAICNSKNLQRIRIPRTQLFLKGNNIDRVIGERTNSAQLQTRDVITDPELAKQLVTFAQYTHSLGISPSYDDLCIIPNKEGEEEMILQGRIDVLQPDSKPLKDVLCGEQGTSEEGEDVGALSFGERVRRDGIIGLIRFQNLPTRLEEWCQHYIHDGMITCEDLQEATARQQPHVLVAGD